MSLVSQSSQLAVNLQSYRLQPCGLPAPPPAVAQKKKLEITMNFQTEEGFGFFNPVKKGAEDAAAMAGAHVDFQSAGGSLDRYKSLVGRPCRPSLMVLRSPSLRTRPTVTRFARWSRPAYPSLPIRWTIPKVPREAAQILVGNRLDDFAESIE